MTNEALAKGAQLQAKIAAIQAAIDTLPNPAAPVSSAQSAISVLNSFDPGGYSDTVGQLIASLQVALTAAQAEFHELSGSFTDGNVLVQGTKDVVNTCPFGVTLTSQGTGDEVILADVYGSGTIDLVEGDTVGIITTGGQSVYLEAKLGNSVVTSGWLTPDTNMQLPGNSTFDTITLSVAR